MALAKTTCSSAIAASDTSIVVASASGFAPGFIVRCGDEMMLVSGGYNGTATIIPVIRGQNGTQVVAHGITSLVTCGSGADWSQTSGASTATPYPLAGKARRISTYGVAGAIALPLAGTDEVAVLNSTVALAMTLAAPTKDLDGTILYIIGDGKAAHTVTAAGGFGLGSTGYTIGTFDTNAACSIVLMAMNASWTLLPSPLSGTLTGVDVAVS